MSSVPNIRLKIVFLVSSGLFLVVFLVCTDIRLGLFLVMSGGIAAISQAASGL